MQSTHMQETGCKSLSARGMQMDRRVSSAYNISFFWSRLLQTYRRDASGQSRWRWQHTSAAFGAALSRTSEPPEKFLKLSVLPNGLPSLCRKSLSPVGQCANFITVPALSMCQQIRVPTMLICQGSFCASMPAGLAVSGALCVACSSTSGSLECDMWTAWPNIRP